jgi:urease accessory protein
VTAAGVAHRRRSLGQAVPSVDQAATSVRPVSGEFSGELHLGMIRDPNGRTVLRDRRQRFPLRTTAPFHFDERVPDMAFVYVQNPTGGVFGGDRLGIFLDCGPRAHVHLTTQSATKVYRTEGDPARQELCLRLSAGAYVEYIPDTLIPQAGADYEQVTRIELAFGAVLIVAETIAAGRVGRGERFAYRRLVLQTVACRCGDELFAERLRFEPARARPDRPGMLGGWDYLVSVTVLAPEHDLTALADAINAELATRSDVYGGAGALPRQAGAFARVLAPDAVSAADAVWSVWTIARRCLLGVPPPIRRK